jgi:hypothetical protein
MRRSHFRAALVSGGISWGVFFDLEVRLQSALWYLGERPVFFFFFFVISNFGGNSVFGFSHFAYSLGVGQREINKEK